MVHVNEVMLPSVLIDDVWDGQPPAGAATTLKVYLSHLRQALTEVQIDGRPPAVLTSRRPGYVLELDPDLIDARRFERWVAESGTRLPADPDGATALLVAALGLWRGPALAEVADLAFARPEVTRLEQLRLTALQWRIEADLGRGRHGELIGELKTLVETYPLHEGFWAQLMRALHAAGRRAEALRVFRSASQVLGEELGIDPSLALQDLERTILLQEPAETAVVDGSRPRSNLPVAATSFVGRIDELAELTNHLENHRLVTVVGEGGSGKTRLAIEIASRLAFGFDRGPWLVELAPVSTADQALRLLAQVTGAREDPGTGPLEAVIETLGDGNALIVLDNCEHLVAALAGPVEDLMRRCPNLRVLATSREGLDIAGERLWRIPTLAMPPADVDLAANAALRFDGVRLLVERATTADPRFRLTDDRVPAVTTICRRLDGMPLALELAAARLRVLSLEEVAARLDDRFQLLGPASRTSIPRQRSLQAAVEWSYDLLTGPERLLFQRLSVFAGTFSLEHVEAVTSGNTVTPDDAVDLLSNLVAKSLVVRLPRSTGPARFRLLETLHQYAADRLADGGEGDDLRERHAAWFTARCQEFSANRFGPGWRRWLERLGEEHDDCRAALTWLVERGDPELALRMATALWRFWDYNYLTAEGRSWLDRALALSSTSDASLRRRALAGSAYLSWMDDDLDGADIRCEQGLALPFGDEDAAGRAALLAIQGEVARHRGGQADRAERLCQEAVALFHRAGDDWGEADAQRVLALLASDAGDLARAREMGEGCLRLWERCGDAERSAGARSLLAGVARDAGDLEQAEALYEQSLAQFRQAKEPWGTAQIIRGLGLVVLARGNYGRAYRLGEECLAMNQQLGNGRGIAQALKLMGDAALQLGQLEEADRRCQEALERLRARGFEPDIRAAQRSAATVALAQGDVSRAASLLDEAPIESADLLLLAVTRIRQGRPDEAGAILDDSEHRAQRNHDVGAEASVLEARAEAAVAMGAAETAARWLDEAAAKRDAAGLVLTPIESADHERTVVALSLVIAGRSRSPHVVVGDEVEIDLRDPVGEEGGPSAVEGHPIPRK